MLEGSFNNDVTAFSSVTFVQSEGKSLNQIHFCTLMAKAGNLCASGGTGYGDIHIRLADGKHAAWDAGGVW
jgi:hypothetical protein